MKRPIIFSLILAFSFLLVACSNPYDNPLAHGDSNNPTKIYFDPLRFIKNQTTKPELMTEKEVINLLGKPSEIRTWKMQNENSQSYSYFQMKAYIYSKGLDSKTGQENFREFDFANNKLVRITIQENIPYQKKADFFRIFNLKKFEDSTIVKNTSLTFRSKNVKIADFWIWNFDDKAIKGVTFTFVDGIFND